ncbi:hypothetical protein KIN20_001566 [Parelaphostrongylus tenuis]|uniref:PABS domain-containing protein n=1 Tax=Parelaphostrongylus tenuis TaxID=148309 RepID=A0AAD5QCD6_PARTN|nr:hypothetical protein KIN20_001566 [Parelaphostrongylus tenuis]
MRSTNYCLQKVGRARDDDTVVERTARKATMRPLWLRKIKQIPSIMAQKKTYRIRILSVISVIICVFLYVFFYFLADTYVVDSQYLDAVDQSVLENRLDFHEVAIAKICSDKTAICYGVYDRKVTEDEHNEVVERHLLMDGFYDESDSAIRLIPPKGESFDSSDTRIWGFDHSDVRSNYVAGMLVGPFLFSSLSLDQKSDVGKNVLEIGLGGGSFSMALHKLKPDIEITVVELDPTVVKIAQEWFGVKDSRNHRIIVDDGLNFLEKAHSKGLKFDVVVLDACDTTMKSVCPAKSFRNTETLKRIKEILKTMGSLIVNILSNDQEGSGSSTREVIQLFTSIFPACSEMRFPNEVNVILTCVPYSISNIREQIGFYNTKLNSVISQLKLDNILKHIVLV